MQQLVRNAFLKAVCFVALIMVSEQVRADILELHCPIQVRVKDHAGDRITSTVATVHVATGRRSVQSLEPNLPNLERNIGKSVTALMIFRNQIIGTKHFVDGKMEYESSTTVSTLEIAPQLISGTITSRVVVNSVNISSLNVRLIISRASGKLFFSKVDNHFFPNFSPSSFDADGVCDLFSTNKPKF